MEGLVVLGFFTLVGYIVYIIAKAAERQDNGDTTSTGYGLVDPDWEGE